MKNVLFVIFCILTSSVISIVSWEKGRSWSEDSGAKILASKNESNDISEIYHRLDTMSVSVRELSEKIDNLSAVSTTQSNDQVRRHQQEIDEQISAIIQERDLLVDRYERQLEDAQLELIRVVERVEAGKAPALKLDEVQTKIEDLESKLDETKLVAANRLRALEN